MNDPYSVLGVSPNASDDEIKKAYRDLARKYHPDNYQGNPLADLAQERMKEINEAYDMITRSRSGSGSGSGSSAGQSYGSSYTGSHYSSTSPEFSRIRSALNMGNISLAEQLLNMCQNRNAEWNFLMGSLYYQKGWFDDARTYYQRAVSMDPGNGEYLQALNYITVSNRGYRPMGYEQNAAGADMCDICTMLMCVNMCCRCNG